MVNRQLITDQGLKPIPNQLQTNTPMDVPNIGSRSYPGRSARPGDFGRRGVVRLLPIPIRRSKKYLSQSI